MSIGSRASRACSKKNGVGPDVRLMEVLMARTVAGRASSHSSSNS